MKYNTLYFIEDVNVDTSSLISSVESLIRFDETVIKGAMNVSAFGGEPSTIDASVLCRPEKRNKPGMTDLPNFTVDFHLNDEDFQFLEGKVADKATAAIEAEFQTGSKNTSTARVVAVYVDGYGLDSMVDCHAVFEMAAPWKYVPKPAGNG